MKILTLIIGCIFLVGSFLVPYFHPESTLSIAISYVQFIFGITFVNLYLFHKNTNPFKTTFNWLREKPVRIFSIITLNVFLIIAFLDFHFLGTGSKWADVLVEAHGLFFDLVLFGVLITIYDTLKEKEERKERYINELEDYRGWTENEAAYRVAGLLKRLENDGGKLDSLDNLNLSNVSQELFLKTLNLLPEKKGDYVTNRRVTLFKLLLKKVSFHHINLKDYFFVRCDFERSSFRNMDFSKSDFFHTNFISTTLENINFQNTSIRQCDFKNAFFENVNLQNANLEGCDLSGVHLFKVDLRKTKLDSVIVDSQDWFEKLSNSLTDLEILGLDEIRSEYFIQHVDALDSSGNEHDFFMIQHRSTIT